MPPTAPAQPHPQQTLTSKWPLHAADLLLSATLIPLANWLMLLAAALAAGSKVEFCFQRCTAPRHIDAWTAVIFLPLLLLAAASAVALLSPARSRWRVWKALRRSSIASLLVVVIALSIHIDALSSIPPWHWLNVLGAPSLGLLAPAAAAPVDPAHRRP